MIYPLVPFTLDRNSPLADEALENTKHIAFTPLDYRSLLLFVHDDEVIEIKSVFRLWMAKCRFYLRFNRLVAHTYILS